MLNAASQSQSEQWPNLGEYLQKYLVAGQVFEAMYRKQEETFNKV